jgi:hypothetical protein
MNNTLILSKKNSSINVSQKLRKQQSSASSAVVREPIKLKEKAALLRQKQESVGMVSFNKCRSMYPTKLNSDDMSQIDPIFHAKP